MKGPSILLSVLLFLQAPLPGFAGQGAPMRLPASAAGSGARPAPGADVPKDAKGFSAQNSGQFSPPSVDGITPDAQGIPALPSSVIPPAVQAGPSDAFGKPSEPLDTIRVEIEPAGLSPAVPGFGEIREFLDRPAEARDSAPVTVLAGLRDLAHGADVGKVGIEAAFKLSGEFYDRSQSPAGTPSGSADAEPAGPLLPPGVRSVSVNVVSAAGDIDRFIPHGSHIKEFVRQLKRDIREMAPYQVYTYYDGLGGIITAIDLSSKPRLIESLPDAHSHEVQLIKKIQVWNQDLQVIVREEDEKRSLKTPDLVMGGVITELKSLIGNEIDFTYLINKANSQVLEHSNRHGLGPGGAVVVDLTEKSSVPVGEVLADLNAWARLLPGAPLPGPYYTKRETKRGKVVIKPLTVHKYPVALDKVFVFAGADLKAFVREADGSYRLDEPGKMPLVRPASTPPRDIHALELLVSRGRLEEALRGLHFLERAAPVPDPHSPVFKLRGKIESIRLLGKLRRLARRRQHQAALQTWENFRRTHSAEAVRAIESEAKKLLAAAKPLPLAFRLEFSAVYA